MKQIKWFDRKFDFSNDQNNFPSIIARLEETGNRLKNQIAGVDEPLLEIKPKNTWSIKENIGHLIDLEPLWQRRLVNILENDEVLEAADLKNKKTFLANHNQSRAKELVKQFEEIRKQSLALLENLDEEAIYKSALHPRLKKPMRVLDLFLFVAEHDDHHLARISEIKNKYLKA